MKLKHRKTLFLTLTALTAGGSMAVYGSLDGDFVSHTIQLLIFQQVVGAAIYFSCFGVHSLRSGSPFE